MGQIYSTVLNQTENNYSFSTRHLILSMTKDEDEFVPPCEAIFYHPFFWSPEEILDFLLVVYDFYEKEEERNNKKTANLLENESLAIPEELRNLFQQCNIPVPKTDKDAIKAFTIIVSINWIFLCSNFKTVSYIT